MLMKSGFIQSFQVALIPVVPVVSTVLLFLVHTLVGYPLTASQVFIIFSYVLTSTDFAYYCDKERSKIRSRKVDFFTRFETQFINSILCRKIFFG